jgi:hypothetical protein
MIPGYLSPRRFYATEPRRPIQQLHGVSIPIMGWLPFARKDPNAFFLPPIFVKALAGTGVALLLLTFLPTGKALLSKKIQDRLRQGKPDPL